MTRKDSRKLRKSSVQNQREHLVLTATPEKTLQFMMNWMQSLQQNSQDTRILYVMQK